ncbi:MAG: phosphoribosylglycinamide formyltransferase [Candidatus Brocadiia bacterium]
MTTIKLAVLLSGSGRTLQNFIDLAAQKKLDAEITAVISSKEGAYGIERAKKHGIPAYIVPRKNYKSDDEFSLAVSQILHKHKPDLIVLAGLIHFYKIPPEYSLRAMNIHPALLPAFGGKGYYGEKVHQAVIKYGVKFSGCTVHFVDNVYDHGPIIIQRVVPVLDDDTPETLADRVFKEECIAYPEAINLYARGKIKVVNNRVLTQK